MGSVLLGRVAYEEVAKDYEGFGVNLAVLEAKQRLLLLRLMRLPMSPLEEEWHLSPLMWEREEVSKVEGLTPLVVFVFQWQFQQVYWNLKVIIRVNHDIIMHIGT